MTLRSFETAIASTHAVLANVSKEQLDDPTPCASWDVRALINHMVGGQRWFAAVVESGGPPPAGAEPPDFAAADFVSAFDEGATKALAAFSAPGALHKTVNLQGAEFPVDAFLGLAITDTFQHGWDLAKATGQETDLVPDMAAVLLANSQQTLPKAFRGDEGAPFGHEQEAPPGASNADKLAAFLGRKV